MHGRYINGLKQHGLQLLLLLIQENSPTVVH